MVATPEIQGSKAGAVAVAAVPVDARVAKAGALAVASMPAQGVQTSSAGVLAAIADNVDIQASKAGVQVVCLGRTEYPYIKAWTFTQDGHDFYVLQLHSVTLVYDLYGGTWQVWGSQDSELWRAQIGVDWNANLANIAAALGGVAVSSVLVGDYQYGALYFLHPEKGVDDIYDGTETRDFKRILYGQITTRGRTVTPCYGVELYGSIGGNVASVDATITLAYSDDEGATFTDADPVYTLTPGEASTWVDWRSLGSFDAPGRLFRVTDYGALVRIDGMENKDA